MAINGGSFYTDAWNVLYYALSGNVSGLQNDITSTFPIIERRTFLGYPFVAIRPPEREFTPVGWGSGTTYEGDVNFDVTAFHTSAAQCDAMIGNIQRVLLLAKNWGGSSGLTINGLYNLRFERTRSTPDSIGGKIVQTKTLPISFNFSD